MAWMSDEEYTYVQDCREKKSVSASAFKARTHCGKGGRVKFPSDYLSKKELKAMNGECKSYRMNSPMSWEEFKSMPDDLKICYIKGLREKFNVPNAVLATMFEISAPVVNKYFKCLGLAEGKGSGASKRTWNRDGFLAWQHGASSESVTPSETPIVEPVEAVEEESNETLEVREEVVEAALAAISEAAVTVLDEMNTNNSDKIFEKYANNVNQYCAHVADCQEKMIRDAGPIAFAGHRMPVIPKNGTMTFEGNLANDALDTIKCLLSNMRVNLTISWECAFE